MPKIAYRKYKCSRCGHETVIQTNHRMECYPQCEGKCRDYVRVGKGAAEQEIVLRTQTPHIYIGELEEQS